MRTLSIVLLAFFATAALADAELTLTVRDEPIPINQQVSLDIQNLSETEDARDLAVEIRLGEGLDFRRPILAGLDWSCTRSGATAVCRLARLGALKDALIVFEVMATDSEGGHKRVDITMTAANAPTQTRVLDIISFRFRTVTTASDFGAGSLRAAIEDINDSPLCGTEVMCFINFTDLRTLIITPATPLPPIRKCNVFLFAPDDPEFPRATKRVAISGENASFGNGLEIRTPPCPQFMGGVSISGIAVHSWPWNGIAIEGTSDESGVARHSIAQTYVGVDYTGLVPKPNGGRGIVLDSPHADLFLSRGIASANGRSGVALFRGVHATISNMRINNNGASGVFSFQVPFHVDGGTITHNAHAGVAIVKGTASATVSGAAIHSNSGLPIDWGIDGRTPPDDETDGVPNTPRILDAFYDPVHNQTIIRGEVRLRGTTFGQRYVVNALLATSPRGDLPAGRTLLHQAAPVPEGVADVPFEIGLVGDYRGQLIALQLHGIGEGTGVVSEVSEARSVR